MIALSDAGTAFTSEAVAVKISNDQSGLEAASGRRKEGGREHLLEGAWLMKATTPEPPDSRKAKETITG